MCPQGKESHFMLHEEACEEGAEVTHDENDWGIEVVSGEQGEAQASQSKAQGHGTSLPEGLEFSMPVMKGIFDGICSLWEGSKLGCKIYPKTSQECAIDCML